MGFCPIWRWYEYPYDPREPGKKEKDYPINSAITGSIKITNGRAYIATDKLEQRGKHLECAVNNFVKKILDEEAEDQPKGKARHYGLIILRPGKKKLSASKVVDFISFYRDPKIKRKLPTRLRYGISAYNKVFEELVLG
jgi:hypothetical protein